MPVEQNSESVITLDRVSKHFDVPSEKNNSLKTALIHPLRTLRASSKRQQALKNVSLKVYDGEFLGIVGKNGSGKSTLLKILAGIYQPDSGTVRVNGSIVPFIELGVGFNAELTGRENIFLSGALLGFSRQQMTERYDAIVGFAELETSMDQKLKNYSSGMQVRLAFSIAIQAKADILLLDEVLAVGDAAFQRKCYNYFQTLKKQKKTVILVTHDMSVIREYCTRAMLIDSTQIIAEGVPDKIAQRYNRLFAEDVDPTLTDSAEDPTKPPKRYGNHDIKFMSVTANKKLNEADDTLRIKVRLKAKAALDNPNIGISIKNASDEFICGTNTRILKKSFGSIKKGDSIDLTWKIPNIFQSGKHYINVAAVDVSEATQYDWWDEAASFVVIREQKTPFVVSPKIVLEEGEG